MADLGSISLALAVALAAYSAIGSGLGRLRRIPELLESSRLAVYVVVLALAVSVISLVGAFLTNEFRIAYVAENSNLAMERIYTWVAFYAGNEGSLLYIGFVLAAMSALALKLAPPRMQDFLPYTSMVLMLVLTFFLAVTYFMANPFSELSFTPSDGQGINPLLTHPGMFIHPPVMMAGLVAVAIPFAFALGALIEGKSGDEWVDSGRTWGIVSWALLGSGLLLGGWWAYTILGWGGYWAWDPVENAGFMPFVALTAFIHSIMVQKRRGMFRMWNIVLINIAFGLALYGMFMNRGGPVPSVHSFGASSLGWIFLMFTAIGVIVPFAIFFLRYNALKSRSTLESTLSREASFLVNNLLLLAIAFVTLWGVVYPLISEAFRGSVVTVAAPFYNQVNGPLMLALVFLMGVGPLMPWRRASPRTLLRALAIPAGVGVGVIVILRLIGIGEVYPLLAFGICAMVTTGIVAEWYRGTRTLRQQGNSYPLAFLRLIAGNRPRYGGYVVHLSVLLLVLGIVGSSFYEIQRDVVLQPGESAVIGEYRIEYVGTESSFRGDRTEFVSTLRAYKADEFIGEMHPQRAFYPDFQMSSTRASIRSTPVEDFYVVPSELSEDGSAGFRVFVNPLVWWMWIAGPMFMLGTVVSLWPRRASDSAPALDLASRRRDVEGITGAVGQTGSD